MAAQGNCAVELAQPIGRLAPSPTGGLHLGNARTFLLGWLSIRNQKGRMILRIEDIDSSRVKPGATQQIIDDLRWLGLDWDYGPDIADGTMSGASLQQSNRLQRYREVLRQLLIDGKVYPCTCTRSQIAERSASAPHEWAANRTEGPIYPGTCRDAPANSADSFEFVAGEKLALRWRFDSGEMQWNDELLGTQRIQPLRRLGDFVIGRGNGHPSYQLAVAVDDADMGVTEVVRGDDLVLSTYRQQAILRHMQWPSPRYFHVPLLNGEDGQRLAKRKGDSLTSLRSHNVDPRAVVGFLAFSAGLIPEPVRCSPSELIDSFDWQKLNRNSFQVLPEHVKSFGRLHS